MSAETVYQTLFGIGAVGLLAQTVMGFAHGGGGHSHGHGGADHGAHIGVDHHFGHADISHGAGHVGHAADAGHAGAIHHAGHGDGAGADLGVGGQLARGAHLAHTGAHGVGHDGDAAERGGPSWGALLSLLSPLTLFSAALGAGATGLLLSSFLRNPLLVALAAVAGGIFLYAAVVQPIYRVIFGFASKPASALEGSVAKSAEAMTRFDARGQGIIKVNVDGQIVRLLANLDPEDTKRGVVVSPGETLVVTSVDAAKNVCQVTRL